jgi:hypothetical protein
MSWSKSTTQGWCWYLQSVPITRFMCIVRRVAAAASVAHTGSLLRSKKF